MDLNADIDVMLADCGDTFTVGDVTEPCLLTMHDEVVGNNSQAPGNLIGMGFVLVRTSAFPDLATNDAVTVRAVDGDADVPYRAIQLTRVQDGRMLQVFLGEP